MHDSDLVETLAVLNDQERERYFKFLESGATLWAHHTSQGAHVISRYIFDCLDNHRKNLSKPVIWSSLSNPGAYNEELLDGWSNTATEIVQEILKKDLRKRISLTPKELPGLLSELSFQERLLILKGIEQKAFSDKEIIQAFISHHCNCLNQLEDALSEAKVYATLFGNNRSIVGKLPKHRSETLKIVRRFIALEMVHKQMTELQESVLLQKFFQERNAGSQYHRVRNMILRRKSEHTQWSSLDYYHVFRSEAVDSDYQGDRNETSTDQNLWETIQSLDEYYLVERLWLSCQLLNQNQITPLALPPFEEWLHFDMESAHLKWFFEKPIGKLFTLAINLLADENRDDEKELYRFIEFLAKHEDSFSTDLVTSFEIFAINYGIRRMNNGNFAYESLIFSVLQRRVEKGRVYKDGMIMANEFQSIATLGLRLSNFEWVFDFMEHHKKKIVGMMPSIKYYQFCQALYLYFTKDLLPALRILMNADYDDLQIKVPSRFLEIKVLCELELSGQTRLRIDEQLDARIEAGILFFFRIKDIPPYKKKMGKRFMDFMKKIIRAKENQRWTILVKIRREVETIDLIAERNWLLKIIDQYLEFGKK